MLPRNTKLLKSNHLPIKKPITNPTIRITIQEGKGNYIKGELGCLTTYPGTAEPAYSYIVYSRFLAIVELKSAPFIYVALLFYPSCIRLLLY